VEFGVKIGNQNIDFFDRLQVTQAFHKGAGPCRGQWYLVGFVHQIVHIQAGLQAVVTQAHDAEIITLALSEGPDDGHAGTG